MPEKISGWKRLESLVERLELSLSLSPIKEPLLQRVERVGMAISGLEEELAGVRYELAVNKKKLFQQPQL